MDLRVYTNVILSGKYLTDFDEENESLILAASASSNIDFNNFFVSGLLTRNDVDVYKTHIVLERMCQHLEIIFNKMYEMYMSDILKQNKCFYVHDSIYFNSRITSRHTKTIGISNKIDYLIILKAMQIVENCNGIVSRF